MSSHDRLDPAAQYRLADGVLSRPTSVGLVVLTPVEQNLALRGPSAVAIWEHLAQPTTISELVSTLAEEFGVPEEVVEPDVLDVIEQLRKAGGLTTKPASGEQDS